MRTPRDVWAACGEDERWLSDQVAMVTEIMREAFAAGFAAGTELGARCVNDHLDVLASNLAMRVPASVPNGLRATAAQVCEIGFDPPAVERAWRTAAAGVGRTGLGLGLLPSIEGAKPDMAAGGTPP